MSCAENCGSIPTNGGAVSRRVREEASSDAPFGPFSVFLHSGSWEPRRAGGDFYFQYSQRALAGSSAARAKTMLCRRYDPC